MSSLVSVILPVHNERENLELLLREIDAALRMIPHEIVAVDDGSTDGSLAEITRLTREFPALRGVALEQRAGQSAALAAGVDASRGDVIVTMDADGQHDPADVTRMLLLLEAPEAPVAVVGFRSRRADPAWVRWQSAVANRIRDFVTGDRVRDSACSFRVMRRESLLRVPRFDGMHRFLPTLLRSQGGLVVQVPIAHRPRRHGRSKYGTLDRALRGVVDIFGVRWLRRRALRYTVKRET